MRTPHLVFLRSSLCLCGDWHPSAAVILCALTFKESPSPSKGQVGLVLVFSLSLTPIVPGHTEALVILKLKIWPCHLLLYLMACDSQYFIECSWYIFQKRKTTRDFLIFVCVCRYVWRPEDSHGCLFSGAIHVVAFVLFEDLSSWLGIHCLEKVGLPARLRAS